MRSVLQTGLELVMLPLLIVYAYVMRGKARPCDIGLGPEPLINNIYHKKALQKYGYTVETFTTSTNFITGDFDIVLHERYDLSTWRGRFLLYMALKLLPFRYRCLYFYFNGGPLSHTRLLWRFEPLIYRIAGIKTVVMPYGSDVQEMSRSNNLLFKHAMTQNYPLHRYRRKMIERRIDLWTAYADHMIGGCEWVDYMYHWDTLMLAHFSIDTESNKDVMAAVTETRECFRILHAPNHRAIKGTAHLQEAVQALQSEGLNIELLMLEGVPNHEVLRAIERVDLVADQFIIGWYAMFAIEAMTRGKPVMCYLREDLLELYIGAGLIEKDEMPIVNTSCGTLKETIHFLYENPKALSDFGVRSRAFIEKHHSLEYIGSVFAAINAPLIGERQ